VAGLQLGDSSSYFTLPFQPPIRKKVSDGAHICPVLADVGAMLQTEDVPSFERARLPAVPIKRAKDGAFRR
jgi:hypothetical protein